MERQKQRVWSDADTPPMSDPVWAEWSAPLLEFLLKRPRSWTELETWRRSRRVNGYLLRNCLAWLEEAGAARSEGTGKDLLWIGWAPDMTGDYDGEATEESTR